MFCSHLLEVTVWYALIDKLWEEHSLVPQNMAFRGGLKSWMLAPLVIIDACPDCLSPTMPKNVVY